MARKKDLVFLGAMGIPQRCFEPWLALFRLKGYKIHMVHNSFLVLDPVSEYSLSFMRLADSLESFDVVGLCHGGNAAIYGAYRDERICRKTKKMVLVGTPIFGLPPDVQPGVKLYGERILKVFEELAFDGDYVHAMEDPRFRERIRFDLHCLYHDADIVAPKERATFPDVGTNYRLDLNLGSISGEAVHNAIYAHPSTFRLVMKILK